jgi:anion-transporting  ArsA/GET3 family ATPase
MSPRVWVCFGTGGVGKTTISAALGCALARRGLRTLVITCDPARRLAEAFEVAAAPTPVRVDDRGLLWCFMPEAADSARRTVTLLFGDDPARLAVLQRNPLFAALVDGLSGVHELAALAQLVELADGYDAVVVDTAPTRHALALLRLPAQIIQLVDSRSLRWLASLSTRRLSASTDLAAPSSWTRLLDWGGGRLIAELEASLGGASVRACMELVLAGMQARPALSRIAHRAAELLTGASTTYLVAAAPREGAARDVAFFHDELASLVRAPTWLVLNRTVEALPGWMSQLANHPRASESLRRAADMAASELGTRARQTRELAVELASSFPGSRQLSVPKLNASQPASVVQAASSVLDAIASEQAENQHGQSQRISAGERGRVRLG